MNRADIAARYPELIRAAEVPVMDTSCACLLQLAAAVREQGYKVTLTGEGADEALAGYVWFKMQKVRDAIFRRPGGPIGTFLRAPDASALDRRGPRRAGRSPDPMGGHLRTGRSRNFTTSSGRPARSFTPTASGTAWAIIPRTPIWTLATSG